MVQMAQNIKMVVVLLVLVGNISGSEALRQDYRGNERVSALFADFINRILRPFIVISQPSSTCTATSGQSGQCITLAACTAKSSSEPVAGKCTGTNVCCLDFIECGGTVKVNNSILVNTGYPASYTGGNCVYKLEKLSENICQMRVDMESLELAPPNSEDSKCSDDTFTFVRAGGSNPPAICGKNNGQHMYLHMNHGPGSASINIATGSDAQDRKWKLKVSQIPCDSLYEAPPSCLQYFTSHSGSIDSFNFQKEFGVHHIGGLSYTICIEKQQGFCSISYKSDDFGISGNASADALPESMVGETNCTTDFLSINVKDKADDVKSSRYCGTGFDPITTYFSPFQIIVNSDQTEDSTIDGNNRGFSIKYNELPC